MSRRKQWSYSRCIAAAGDRCAAGMSANVVWNSRMRRARRCSTAARTRSFLCGKWCTCAPRETPARRNDLGRRWFRTSPRSIRHSIVAFEQPALGLGAAVGVRTPGGGNGRHGHARMLLPIRHTVKPVCKAGR